MKNHLTFLLKLLITRVIALMIYGIMFSSSAAQAADNGDPAVADLLLSVFGAMAFAIFNLVLILQYARNGSLRREFWAATRDRTLAHTDLMRYSLREILICTAIFAAVQLPYCIFYTAFGYNHIYAIFIDQLFIMDVGFYTLCGGSGFLGLIVSAALFAAVQLTARMLVLHRWDAERLR